MARYIYLLRHGRPELPAQGACCIGRRSNPPLGETGRIQAAAWQGCFDWVAQIWCSSLQRSRQTAELLTGKPIKLPVQPGLDEIDVGQWEGLSFAAIRERFPERYAARGLDWALPPTGGEELPQAADRMQSAMWAMLKNESGDVAAVGHEGSIRALIWRLERLNPQEDAMFRQPYGSLTVLKYEYGALTVTAAGKLPEDFPADDEVEEIWDLCGATPQIRAHCRAVADECLELREKLKKLQVLIPWQSLRAAALLHDACRLTGREHPELAASILRERGYLKVARMIEGHHDPASCSGTMDGAGVLFLADKRILETTKVTLEERFAASLPKCQTVEAKKKHQERLEAARVIQKRMRVLALV
jgi:broad specificity phosphatase PhoE